MNHNIFFSFQPPDFAQISQHRFENNTSFVKWYIYQVSMQVLLLMAGLLVVFLNVQFYLFTEFYSGKYSFYWQTESRPLKFSVPFVVHFVK